MKRRMTTMVLVLSGCLLAPTLAAAQVQIPGVGKLSVPALPQKADMQAQAKQMVDDLTAMKSSGKLAPDQAGKVDALLPKATALNAELEKPQVEASKLSQLVKDLDELQKQVGALKSMMK